MVDTNYGRMYELVATEQSMKIGPKKSAVRWPSKADDSATCIATAFECHRTVRDYISGQFLVWLLAIASIHWLSPVSIAQTDRNEVRPVYPPQQQVDAVVTRQKLFSIPFEVDDQLTRPREIYLFVSGNRGERWSLYQRRPAQDRKFDFQAGEDGEYWFAVGTDTVRIEPDRKTRPEKIVIVDTEQPRINLQVMVLQQGRLTARWLAVDDTLSSTTFQLSYQTASSPDWKRIDVILPRDQANEFDGEVSWMVNDIGPIDVKAEIMDRAGNTGSVVQTIPLSSTNTRGDAADLRPGPSNERLNPGTTDYANDRTWASPTATSRSPQSDPYSENTLEADRGTSLTNTGELVGTRKPLPTVALGADAANLNDWRGDQTNSQNSHRNPQQPSTTDRAVTRYSRWSSDTKNPERDNEANRQASPQHDESRLSDYQWRDRPTENQRIGGNVEQLRNDDQHERADQPGSTATPNASLSDVPPQSWDHIYGDSADKPAPFRADPPNDDSPNDDSPNDDFPNDDPRTAAFDEDQPIETQVTNSKVFNLDYDVSDLGNADLARVELWMTQNGGTTWQPHGTDEDLQSPFYVEVNSDGVYGFQLLIHANTGHSTRPPQSGDVSDVKIEVDTEKPVAHLTAARFNRTSTTAPLEIEWQATDKNLSSDAITLSYAETIHGPWVIISNNVPNTGRFSWQLPENLPRSIFIQIDVQDRAGNRTVHRMSEPTLTRPSNPRAIIKSIRTTRD